MVKELYDFFNEIFDMLVLKNMVDKGPNIKKALKAKAPPH